MEYNIKLNDERIIAKSGSSGCTHAVIYIDNTDGFIIDILLMKSEIVARLCGNPYSKRIRKEIYNLNDGRV